MPKFKASSVISMLKRFTDEEKNKKSQSCLELKDEIKNVLDDTKIILYRQSREDAIKYILWQGLLNKYGIFGSNRRQHRLFGQNKIDYYSQEYQHGDIVSIDFGTSNIGNEFSFTHTALVLHEFTDFLIVIPITTAKDGRLEKKPLDEQESTFVIRKNDFSFIESDSYVLIYQLKSISKNRITKRIGNISGSKFLCDIDSEVFNILLDPLSKKFSEEITNLNIKISDYENIIEEKDAKITELDCIIKNLKEEIENNKNMLTNYNFYDKI